MTAPAEGGPRLTALGQLLSLLCIAGLIAAGGYLIYYPRAAGVSPVQQSRPIQSVQTQDKVVTNNSGAAAFEMKASVPGLPAASAYKIQDNTLNIELSEYAGYAGLIAANGGLSPTEKSLFFKKHGFKVRLTISEEESWAALNTGKLAASATTVDVLSIYGRQFEAIVPAQIGFSRGADGLVVSSEINRINGLKGKVLATAQFTEADFFIRYLAQEAGLGIQMLPDLNATPNPNKVNLVYCSTAFGAGDAFLAELQSGHGRLAGCVTWEPKTSEIVNQSGGRARTLTTNRNLLIIADVLVVNKGLAQQEPDKIAALVDCLFEGNRMVVRSPETALPVVASAFKWDLARTKSELEKVHLSNLPENLAFFSGTIDSAGSFGGIYQTAVLSYADILKDPADGDRFLNTKFLEKLKAGGAFSDEKVSIAPIRIATSSSLERNPLLSKNIRFLFAPNSADLDPAQADNTRNLESIDQMLKLSPGSTILLRGHVDNSQVEEFQKKGGDAFVRQMALKAMEMSKRRASEIKRLLIEKFGIDPQRVEVVGRGWEEPAGVDPDENRRVEVQWFTLE